METIKIFINKGITEMLERDDTDKSFWQVLKSIHKECWVMIILTSLFGAIFSIAISYGFWAIIDSVFH